MRRTVISPPPNTLAARVWQLVAYFHDRSVLRAAKDIGIPQRTLARIVDGSTPNPRIDVLSRIAKRYQRPVEWLLSGRGAGHAPGEREGDEYGAAGLRWQATRESLDLPNDSITALFLHALPHATLAAEKVLDVAGFAREMAVYPYRRRADGSLVAIEKEKDPKGAEAFAAHMHYLEQAKVLGMRSWTAFLQALIVRFGTDGTRQLLVRHLPELRSRFATHPPLSPEDLDAIAAEQRELGGVPPVAVVQPGDTPPRKTKPRRQTKR